jgi:peptidoglycan/LPS O-acetylase OafA/YrhL
MLPHLVLYVSGVAAAWLVLRLSNLQSSKSGWAAVDRTCGDFSYPVYLAHWAFAYLLVAISDNFWPELNIGQHHISLATASGLMSCAFGFLISKYIDRPIQMYRASIRNSTSRINPKP